MNSNFKPVKTVLAALIGMTLTASAIAATNEEIRANMSNDNSRMTSSQYKEMQKNTTMEYNSSLKACGTTMGAERTMCRKDARTARNAAMADARAKRGPMTSPASVDVNAGGAAPSANETAGPSGTANNAKNRNMGSTMDRSSGIVGSPSTGPSPKSANETPGPK